MIWVGRGQARVDNGVKEYWVAPVRVAVTADDVLANDGRELVRHEYIPIYANARAAAACGQHAYACGYLVMA